SVHALDRQCDRGGVTGIIFAQRAGRDAGSRDRAAVAPTDRRCDREWRRGSSGGSHRRGHSQWHAPARRAGGHASCSRNRTVTRSRRRTMTTLRLAIVGFGKIARDQHVPAIAATSGVTLAAVASRNASLPELPHFATLEELLRDR